MLHIVIYGPSGCTIFSPLSYKLHDFRKEKLLNIKCVFWFSLHPCLKYLPFEENLKEIWWKTYIGLHVKYPLFLSDFTGNWIFSTDFRKILEYQISLRFFNGSRVAPCRWADGRTDMTMLVSAFRNFANAPKNQRNSVYSTSWSYNYTAGLSPPLLILSLTW